MESKKRAGFLLAAAVPLFLLSCSASPAPGGSAGPNGRDSWTFVSIPDFLNVDIGYPQPEWEEALRFVLRAIKAEDPDFVMVAGDLVQGRWHNTKEGVEHWADVFYPAWVRRMEHHGLKYYAGIGDHELGDNPWRGEKTGLVPLFRKKFREHLKMPLNGPEPMKGTAFWWRHGNVLFVSVDMFEEGKGSQGEIVAQVTGRQLEWFEGVLREHPGVDHVIVMGHTPVAGPVRARSSSRLMLDKGPDSLFWKAMARHGVDLYLCGEVHAMTSIERDGVLQVSHGGLFGYNPQVNYLVARVSPGRIRLELKEIDIVNEGPPLFQPGRPQGCPATRVRIAPESLERGFRSVGTAVLEKGPAGKRIRDKTGLFDEKGNP